MKTTMLCPDCKRRMVLYQPLYCEYIKKKDGYYSGCGYRVAYNSHWHYCPHCGKHICNLSYNPLEKENNGHS